MTGVTTLPEIAKLGILGLFLALFVGLYLASIKGRKDDRKLFDDQLKLERGKVDKMADKLYDLGTTMVQVNTEFKVTLQSVEKDIDEIRRNQI